ncbi:MAG TPA: glycosyltransferase family 39 protein [Bryobacteraceae bacterium]|nr:glycosyltransferase family 39 protein [Bryobacteraceae bacterium]
MTLETEAKRPGIPRLVSSDTGALMLIALAIILLHALTNGHYGFHRDELATVDDARYLDWGYIAYPPLTPFIAHIAFALFGPSLVGLRFFASLAQAVAIVLTGCMARELGGKRTAQVAAALAAAIAPVSLAAGALFQYVTFDYLWWVLAAYFVIRLLKSENPRWWLAIGAVIGLGMMTKYTVAFLAAGITAGIVLTSARRDLKSPWLWGGVGLSLAIFLPNSIWQIRHDFISLDFLNHIHARDIRIGRTKNFLIEQLFVPANPFTIPMWLTGLWFYFSREGKRYRALGWIFVVVFVLFFSARGRSYYMAPAYPMLLAAGAVAWERRLANASPSRGRLRRAVQWSAIAVGAVIAIALVVPIPPVGSAWWNLSNKVQDDWREEVGWPDLVGEVAKIRDSLPAEDRTNFAILTGNYGEAGAIDLYGATYGLPKAISGTNSYWLRGYGDPPPQTLIVTGVSRRYLERHFEFCELAGHVTNRYSVLNEETREHPDIFVCRGLREPWPEFWIDFKNYG